MAGAQLGVVGFIGAAVVTGCSSIGLFRDDQLLTVTETTTKPVPTATTITSTTNPVTAMPGDGVYEVGKVVASGRYATTGAPTAGASCRWSLLPYKEAPFEKALSGGFTNGPGELTVFLGDIIRTEGGCIWTLSQ